MFVVIQPNSLTNPGSDYLVVENKEWVRTADGDASALHDRGHRFPTYAEAEEVRNRLNSAQTTDA